MSLKLVWNDNAPTYPDCNLKQVVSNVIESGLDTFQFAQSDLLNAFRLAIVSNQIEHNAITLQVQQTIYEFNRYGNFDAARPWPVPSEGDRIVEEILLGQMRKKRAQKVDQAVD